ncbi:MAG: fatty acyl-AMP ligase [Alphaproteobacteria bacterium]|nr:fatty acyl-AMP ligase [Alphaproteobacteria bacterium]
MRIGPATIPPQAALPNPALPATVIGSLKRAARMGTRSDGLRFLDRKESETFLSWAELHERALRVGHDLRAAGVLPGERVAIVLPTGPAFVDCFLGILAAGGVPAPMYPPVRLGRMEEYVARTAAMLGACGAVGIISDARIRRVLGRVLAEARPRLGVLAAEELGRGPADSPVPRNPDDLALVQFSSGTTVRPKPVSLTNLQVLANVDAIVDFMPLDARDPDGTPYSPAGVSWLPLYHDMGLIGCIFVALRRPGPLTLLPPEAFLAKPALWLRAISRYRGTVSPAPNFAYALCVERIEDADIEGVDLSSWRFALNGAEPVTPAVLRRFQDRFAPYGLRPEALTPVYGLSEAALAVSFSDPWQPFRARRFSRAELARGRAREATAVVGVGAPTGDGPDPRHVELASVGRPLRGYGIEVRDDDDIVLPTGRVGHIWVSGPSLMAGYLDRDEQPLVDGWLDTGDLGFIHRGDLYVHGRAKDVIIVNGANHAPGDIEGAVDEVDGVRAGCAVAVGDVDDVAGERLVVFVEYREPREELAEDCRRAIQGRTGLDPALVVLLSPGTLPRTSSGKLRRGETLRQWKDGTLQPPDRVTPLFLAGTMARSALGYFKARRESE